MMFFKGKKAQAGAAAGAAGGASKGKKILGALLKTGRGARVVASKINPLTSAGFSKSTVAAGAVGGAVGGVAGGAFRSATSNMAGGLNLLAIVIVFDFVAFMSGKLSPIYGVFAQALFAFVLLKFYLPDLFIRGVFFFKLLALAFLMIPGIITLSPEFYHLFGLTIANHAFPIFTVYLLFTGFLFNRPGGKLLKILYVLAFFGLISLSLVQMEEQVNDAFSKAGIDVRETFTGQDSVFVSFMQAMVGSSVKTASTVKGILLNSDDVVKNILNRQISQAGGEDLYGEPKERPKLGIVIQDHPYGLRKLGDEKIAKAVLFVENRPDENFLEISDVTCSADTDGTSIRADELKKRLDKGEKIKIFYNSPMTVTCTFTEGNTDDFEEISKVKFSVKYDFEENAKLITYLMRDDLRQELFSRGEEPLDFMAVPSNKRHPTTVYDNGPARIGIGPVDLTTPPFGIGADPNLEYPDFELVIGNKLDFNGVISNISSIKITLPTGFALEGSNCAFAGNNPYILRKDLQAENRRQFENIKSSRYFNCDMKIDDNALGGASFAEVEFDVALGFTYETSKTVRLKSS